METPNLPARNSTATFAAFAALACGAAAIALTVWGALVVTTVTPLLLAVALCVLAFGLREFSVRAQFADQADFNQSSLRVLEQKNRWLNATEAHAKIGHWRLELDSDDVFWSDATFAIHGMKPGRTPDLERALEFYHPDDREIVVASIEKARDTGEAYTFRARLTGADGRLRYVSAGASVECAADGTPIALFGVLKDRTAEEAMQQEMRTATDKAEALAQSKGLFLARMSHEIRTPMNGVLGFAELLARSTLAPEQQRHTDLIIESGKTLQTLLNDILDLSKIEAGKVEVHNGTVDILHLIYRVTQMAEPSAREKSIRIASDTSPDLPRHVVLDALRLRQILTNLISNAVRFTDEGGVSLSVRCVEGKLRFAVCDTGTGISARMQENIFDPFTQECTHATNSRGGTGLGLAISRQLAELMGGTLSVRSELGKGSVFTLTLPLVGASAPEITPKSENFSPASTFANPAAKVLLAEDYDINRELIADMTQQLGVEIECAVDGVEAVAMVHHARTIGHPYAMVLMDLQMPKLDGLEATQRLREGGVSEDELPIVALTANAFADDVENCLAAGMQAHLAKPLTMDRLSEALHKWMPNWSEPGPEQMAQTPIHME